VVPEPIVRQTAGTMPGSDIYTVEVRRPLHRDSPSRRMRTRWTARRDARRKQAEQRRAERGHAESKWYDFIPVPFDLNVIAVAFLLFAFALAAFFFVPYLWLGVLFGVELIVWVALTGIGYAAWLLLGRPWTVAVVGTDGEDVATADVRGRRQARLAAETIRRHLAAGLAPDAAMQLRAAFDSAQ
jgi:hypothetical protein